MIGYGRFEYLTTDMDAPGIPDVNQEQFNEVLHQTTGCQLAWHVVRRVFVVFRSRGDCAKPITYMDLGREHWPLHDGLLPFVQDSIHWFDGVVWKDIPRLRRITELQFKDRQRKAYKAYADERFPDFIADFNRWMEIASDGRRRTKFMDFGATKSVAS